MSHPNIIKVTDLIEENDTVAFVMEYIDGETLKEYLDRKGKLKDDEIKTIFSQMLDAVSYVHEQNLVHRDIKPSNFMIDKKGKVKLMDFGIAKNTDANSAEYTQTGTGMQMGTPIYMSPEQITETKSVTAQSDIYTLGVVLWQMVRGQKPYDTKTLSSFQLQMMIVNDALTQTNTAWDAVIQKCTQKDVGRRFIKCAEIAQALNTTSIKADPSLDSTVVEQQIIEIQKEKSNFNLSLFVGAILLVLISLSLFFFKEDEIKGQLQEPSTVATSQKPSDIDTLKSGDTAKPYAEKPTSVATPNTPPDKEKRKETKTKIVEEEIVAFVEIEPEYPGGIEKLYEEIYKSITYPEMERENNIQGTVYISFVVEKTGAFTDIKIERGVNNGPNLGKEAEKAVRLLKPFSPAKMNGKAVRYRYRMPIKFTLK
jgi:TonB family protein